MVANTGKIIATKSAGTGKKANHTRKGQLIVLPNGKDIVDVVAGKPSPKSDVNLFHETKNKSDKKQKFSGDKADQGEELMKTPTKNLRINCILTYY